MQIQPPRGHVALATAALSAAGALAASAPMHATAAVQPAAGPPVLNAALLATGGAAPGERPRVPRAAARPRRPQRATLSADGRAIAPAGAPRAVRAVIAAGNRIAHKPYVWGGGHGSWSASGYDCSGSVSYALHGGRLIAAPEASGGLMSWGRGGRGRWISVYANGGHVYMVVAGLRFDTSMRGSDTGSRWQRAMRSGAGYAVRHPAGL